MNDDIADFIVPMALIVITISIFLYVIITTERNLEKAEYERDYCQCIYKKDKTKCP